MDNLTKVQPWDYYVEGVLSGNIPACDFIKKACQRHLNDIARSTSPDGNFAYVFNPAKADRVIKFFSRLQLTKGLPYPGKKFKPELWQCFILAMLFGWVSKITGLRRFRKGHIMVPRKNGKSHLFAGIGLYGTIADNEMGSEVYSAATKKDQAKIIWEAAVEFRRHSGNLAQLVEKSVSSLFVRQSGSKFQPLSSDEDGLDGLNTHIGLVDEYQNHKTAVVYERIDTSTSSRDQPLLLSTGTAGTDPLSPCGLERNYAANVLTGDFNDDTYFSFLAEADEEDAKSNWDSVETWYKANPNLGISKKLEYMVIQCQAAKNEPAKLNAFLRLDLNIWTQQDYAWMPMDKWRRCTGPVQLKYEEEKVRVIHYTGSAANKKEIEDAMLSQWRQPFAGLDLSERGDITSLVLLFPPSSIDPTWVVLTYHFVPDDCVEKRSKNDRVPYDLWIKEGRINKTPGVTVDYDFVKAEVLRLHSKLHFKGLAVDPHNALMLNNQLRGEGVPVVEVQQGWKSLSDPTKELMAWVLGKKINHLNDPVLNWMAGNVAIKTDPQGNIVLDKSKARERIDGMAALVNAMHLALSQSYSVYSSRGLITI